MKKNSWNIKMTINFDKKIKKEILNWYNLCKNKKSRKYDKNIKLNDEAKNYLLNFYNDGYGLKVISRELEFTYTIIRKIFELNDIKIRKGRKVVTDKVKKFRSYRVSGKRCPWYNWPNNEKFKEKLNTSRGIQGYYLNNKNEKIWLRSTWEYIYAKWLDKNNIVWKFEEKNFKLSNGECYRPDFFIYENDKLKYIVEIKGYFKNREYKVDLLKNDYNIDIIIVDNIKNYCKNYYKELKEWKKIRILNSKK